MTQAQRNLSKQRRRDPDEKRERLLEGAKQVFVNLGFEKTTNKLIVEQSGVSEGILYHQFNSKFGVFRELIRLYALDAVKEFRQDDQTVLSAEQIIRNLIAFVDRDPAMFKLIDNSSGLLIEHRIPTLSDLVTLEIERSIQMNLTDSSEMPADPSVMARFQYAIVETAIRGWLSEEAQEKKEAFALEGIRSMQLLLFTHFLKGS